MLLLPPLRFYDDAFDDSRVVRMNIVRASVMLVAFASNESTPLIRMKRGLPGDWLEPSLLLTISSTTETGPPLELLALLAVDIMLMESGATPSAGSTRPVVSLERSAPRRSDIASPEFAG